MKRHFSKSEIVKQRPYVLAMVLTMLFCAGAARGQTSSSGTGSDREDHWANLNRFSLSYRMGLNISARFKNLGGYPALAGQTRTTPDNTDPLTGQVHAGLPYNYDDGYNLPDNIPGHNIGGIPVTTYWGYDGNPDQVVNGNTIVLHQSTSAAGASTDSVYNSPQNGVELTYTRILAETGRVRWGVDGAVGYTYLSFDDNSTLSGAVTRSAYSFAFRGTSLPPAPYQGSFYPPGASLDSTPTGRPDLSQSFAPGSAGASSIAGSREITADVYGLRLGPSAEINLGKGFAACVGGGFALVSVNSEFNYQESVSIPSAGTAPFRSGSGSHCEWLAGGYIGANFCYALSKSVDVTAGVQYQNVGTYKQVVDGKEAAIDLSKSIFVTIGIGYSF